MAQPRKHHYLPQFYLRGFSPNGRSIFQIEKTPSRGYLCSIRDAAAIRDYHELDYSDAEDPHVIEKRLAEIEGQFSRTLTDVVQSGITSTEVHVGLIEFVALMKFRVPAFKTYIEESLRQSVRSVGMIMERKGALPPIPKGFEGMLRMDRAKISISNWKCLEFMVELATDPRLLRLLLAMRPSILRAKDRESLLTCDQPVALFLIRKPQPATHMAQA